MNDEQLKRYSCRNLIWYNQIGVADYYNCVTSVIVLNVSLKEYIEIAVIKP